ncbi:hypothetical protein TCDM_10522 [Trypanosoma cruzi Dm28c]|uniref:Uncharacterized protein n=1 Tax=Trypanosoma cruzi Dm28c TaxID=1416333 RepID=V5D2Y8_TRYCR|nr:hypothetical protein TCDM_10522 [Trypanosoma cruzi Dm28c]
MRVPRLFHGFLNRRLVRWSPPKIQACNQATHAGSTTRALEMDQALPPPPHHRRHGLLIPRRTTGDSASSTAVMPVIENMDCDCL